MLGGIDVFGNAIETLRDNGVPFVGGIPVSEQSVKSENSYQWSGGSWGATVAFAEYAAKELDAKKVSIVYGEFGSISRARSRPGPCSRATASRCSWCRTRSCPPT